MAITYTEVKTTYLSDEVLSTGYLTFDGSATTIVLPVGTIDFAIIAPASGTAVARTCSWSGSTLTVSNADTDGNTAFLMFAGTA